MNPSKEKLKKIYFIGIGGSGMSGLAELLFNLGYQVTGSDINKSTITDRLNDLGINLKIGHEITNLGDAEMVIKSSAILETNVELIHARKLGLPILERAELLSSLMNMKRGIAVAGTHGKGSKILGVWVAINSEIVIAPALLITKSQFE